MKNIYKWLILSILMVIVFILTFVMSPEQITKMLRKVTMDTSFLAIIIHFVYLVIIILSVTLKRSRNILLSVLLLILSGTATVVSIKYFIIPNIIIFITFFILTLFAIAKKQLNFGFAELKLINKVVGIIAIIFGFYYLHWVDEPLFLNALIYSPLGIVNCPTMVAYCGLLCFLKKPGDLLLEFFTAAITLYFGFFGLMRLGAYIDVVLIAAGMFLIIRMASKISYENFYFS